MAKERYSPAISGLLTGPLLLAALASTSCRDADKPPEAPPSTAPAGPQYDEDYVAALSSADEFCRAWKAEDYPTVRAMLTRRLLISHPERKLDDTLGGTGNPRHGAYEIFDGERLGTSRFAFNVRLFLTYIGASDTRIEAPIERVVIARDDTGRWRVDEFSALQR